MALSSRFKMWLYPELKWFENEAARKEAWRQCGLRSLWTPYLISWTLSALTAGWVILYQQFSPLLHRKGMYPFVSATLASIVVLALGALQFILMFGYHRRKVRPRLRELLAERGILLCESCGYNLTGIADGICPECGVHV